MTFEESLIISLIDKIGFGVLVAFAAFLLNRQLEIFKSRQDEKRLIAADKRKRIGEQLSEFYWPIYLRLEKDTAIYEQMLRKYSDDPEQQDIGHEVETSILLPNHEEILRLIDTKIHLAKFDEEFFDELKRYSRHISLYKALRAIGDRRDPNALGEPWPDKLFPLLKEQTFALQREYESLTT